MKVSKSTFAIVLGIIILLQNPTWAPAQTGAEVRSKAAEQNKSTAINNVIQMTDIHDIKVIENVGVNPALLGYAVMGAVILVLLTAIVLFWKKQQKKKIPEVVASISPEEHALNALAELQDLMRSNGKQFYFRLSMVLRVYIRHRFGMDAPEMTTEELLSKIAELKLESDLDRGVRDFVHASDPIKFAGQTADIEVMQMHFDFVRSFVKRTTPPPIEAMEISAAGSETNP